MRPRATCKSFLEARKWRFAIIGGLALLRWGEPRFNRNVDVSLLRGFGREDEFITPFFASGYRGQISDAAAFARQNRVLLLEAQNGVPIDIALAGLPYEEMVVERSSMFEFAPGCSLRTCSSEDLVVFKLFAFRRRDLVDVETVALRQRSGLDWDYVERELSPLADLKGSPEIMEALAGLRHSSS